MMTNDQQPTMTSASEPMQPTATNAIPTDVVQAGSSPHCDISTQPTNQKPQPEMPNKSDRLNPTVSRALIGGLIGASLGLIAGALAGRKTSHGLNHAKQGVGNALKTVGDGLGQTTKGLGDAVKSVAEGVSYAVVGGTVDAAQGLAEGAQQVTSTTTDVVQATAESVSHRVQQATESVKQSGEETKQAVIDAVEGDKAVEISSEADPVTQSLRELQAEASLIEDRALNEMTPMVD